MGGSDQGHRISEWRQGWPLLVVATIGLLCANVSTYMIGLLVKPLGETFGWSRASVSSGILIAAFGTLALSPVVGPLLDRVGPRRVGLWGIPLMACGIAAIGLSGPSLISWYIGWTCFAIGQAFANVVIWSSAIVSRFDRNRGTALGLYMAGVGFFYGLGPLIGVFLLSNFGWRSIFFAIAGFTLLVAWPLAWRWLYGAGDLGPDRLIASPPAEIVTPGQSFQSLRTWRFWQIAIACAISAGGVSALLVHLQPILTDTGISIKDAALVTLAISPASVFGRLLSGFLLDRLPPNLVGAAIIIFSGLPYFILAFGDVSIAIGILCAGFLGLAAGAETDLLAYLSSRYFPPGSFGRTFAILTGIFSVGFGFAPIAAGAVFDASASYAPIFLVMTGLAALGALLIAALGRPDA
jgi:predicted MFS family arabinose efflux permease